MKETQKLANQKAAIKDKLESHKVSFINKTNTKLSALIVAMVLIPMLILTLVSAKRTTTAMEETYQTYAMNLAQEAAVGIDSLTDFGEEVYLNYALNLADEAVVGIDASIANSERIYLDCSENIASEVVTGIDLVAALGLPLDATRVATILSNIKIKGVEGSYAYAVAPTGVILWHPDSSKIGQPIKNEHVLAICTKLAKGEKVENGAVMYENEEGKRIDGYAFTAQGLIIMVTADYDQFVQIDYDTLLGDISINGVEGSYAYMVAPDGTMLWHPNKDKVGQPVENAAVKGIVSELQAGRTVNKGSVVYDYKGSKKIAGYSFTTQGNIVLVTADYEAFIKIDYDELLGNLEITNVAGSYAYMVSSDGTMLWHPNKDKIGQPVENAAVKDIVARLSAGEKVEPDSIIYEYKGANKLAGFSLTKDNSRIAVVTADYDEFIGPVNELKSKMIRIGLTATIFCCILGYVIVMLLMKVIDTIVPIINRAADLDLRPDEHIHKVSKRKDEFGVMAKAIERMTASLNGMVGNIAKASGSIDDNIEELSNSIRTVDNLCTDNSATTEELAAGMQETSASISAITGNVENIQAGAQEIKGMANTGNRLSVEVMGRAGELKRTTEEATRTTTSLYESVKEKSEAAIESSKAVEKINELTRTIMAISSRTSLLALNASIEAARAGEAGRGFSVVASEIGNLADQSSSAVKDISTIVGEVNGAVGQMSECIEELIEFLEKNVLSDYDNFGKVSDQYRNDAASFKDSMGEIEASVNVLTQNINMIVDAINGINDTIGDTANGITDIAGKTTDMVSEAAGNTSEVDSCKDRVKELNDIINKFKR